MRRIELCGERSIALRLRTVFHQYVILEAKPHMTAERRCVQVTNATLFARALLSYLEHVLSLRDSVSLHQDYGSSGS